MRLVRSSLTELYLCCFPFMSSTESWNLQSRTSESSVTNYFSFLNFLIASNKYIDFLHSSFLCPATPCLCMCCLSVRTQTFHLFSICSPWISHFRSTKFVLQFNHGNVTYIFIYLKINIFPKSPIQLFFWGRSSRMRGVKWVGQGEVACHVASISPKCQCHMRLGIHLGQPQRRRPIFEPLGLNQGYFYFKV